MAEEDLDELTPIVQYINFYDSTTRGGREGSLTSRDHEMSKRMFLTWEACQLLLDAQAKATM